MVWVLVYLFKVLVTFVAVVLVLLLLLVGCLRWCLDIDSDCVRVVWFDLRVVFACSVCGGSRFVCCLLFSTAVWVFLVT